MVLTETFVAVVALEGHEVHLLEAGMPNRQD